MIERGEQTRLAREARAPLGVLREMRRKDLDRDVTTEVRVVRPIHFTHSAGTQQRDDFVRAQCAPLHRCECGVC